MHPLLERRGCLDADSHLYDRYDSPTEPWFRSERPHRVETYEQAIYFTVSERNVAIPGRALSEIPSVFAALCDSWKPEARFQSVTARVAMLPAYQKIIGLGPAALPEIMRELSSDRSPMWFPALTAIVGTDIAVCASSVSDAVERWLEWGRARKFL